MQTVCTGWTRVPGAIVPRCSPSRYGTGARRLGRRVEQNRDRRRLRRRARVGVEPDRRRPAGPRPAVAVQPPRRPLCPVRPLDLAQDEADVRGGLGPGQPEARFVRRREHERRRVVRPGEPSGREVQPQNRARERRVGVRPVRDDERLPRTVVPELGVPPLDRALTPVARERVGEQRDRVAGRDDRVDPVAHAALAGDRDAQRGVARQQPVEGVAGHRSRRSRRRPRRHRRAQLHGVRAPGPGRSGRARRRRAPRIRRQGGRPTGRGSRR